jgi:hypothetical protein
MRKLFGVFIVSATLFLIVGCNQTPEPPTPSASTARTGGPVVICDTKVIIQGGGVIIPNPAPPTQPDPRPGSGSSCD